jgi:S1-C subfamily serine protease
MALEGLSKPQVLKTVSLALTSVLFAICVFLPASAISSPRDNDPAVNLLRGVVIVTTYDGRGKPFMQGTGFFVRNDRIVTNYHVVRQAGSIQVATFDKKIATVQRLVAFDNDSDLAVLQVDPVLVSGTVLQLDDASLSEGEPVTVISNPRGDHWKIEHGRVGSTWNFQNQGPRIEITMTLRPGSSGGPIVNGNGRVVGVAVMSVGGADSLNFAIPIERLRSLAPFVGEPH